VDVLPRRFFFPPPPRCVPPASTRHCMIIFYVLSGLLCASTGKNVSERCVTRRVKKGKKNGGERERERERDSRFVFCRLYCMPFFSWFLCYCFALLKFLRPVSLSTLAGSLPDCFELLQKFEDKKCVARRRGALFCKPVLQEYFVLL